MSFGEALEECALNNGRLASPETEEEWDQLRQHIVTSGMEMITGKSPPEITKPDIYMAGQMIFTKRS